MSFDVMKKALLDALKTAKIEEYEIYYTFGSGVSVDTLNKEVSAFSSSDDQGVCLRVLVDGKMGYASSELFTEGEMVCLVERARENAKSVEKLDTVGIFSGSDSYEELRLKKYVPMSAAELRRAAVDIGNRLFAYDDRVKDGSTSQAFTSGMEIGIINSHGLDLNSRCGINVIVSEAVVAEGGEQQSDYSYTEPGDDYDSAVDRIVKESVEDAVAKLGAALVPTGKYNVVIDGKQMRSLLSVYSSAFSAKRVLDGMSPLKDKEGTKIASDVITLTDDPQREGNAMGITFDAEGVATHRKAVIEKGILKTLLYNRETAMAMGKETTANAMKGSYSSPIGTSPYSFCIEPGEDSFDELLRKTGDGIFITEIKGLHAGANAVTGEFSLESAGFMIRGGRLCEPVKSFTVAGNFFDMLKEITAVGDKLELGVQMGITGFGSPAVLVPKMSIAGK